MATPSVTLASGVLAGGPAVAFISSNARVKSQQGFLGTQADVVLFGGPMMTGAWAIAATRSFVQGVPAVLQTSTGVAMNPVATAPMTVVMGDPRVMGT
jgi:hypothetical protein